MAFVHPALAPAYRRILHGPRRPDTVRYPNPPSMSSVNSPTGVRPGRMIDALIEGRSRRQAAGRIGYSAGMDPGNNYAIASYAPARGRRDSHVYARARLPPEQHGKYYQQGRTQMSRNPRHPIIFRVTLSLWLLLCVMWPLQVSTGAPTVAGQPPENLAEQSVPASSDAGPAAAIPTLDFISVAAGADHTCGLTSGGAVKCWGENQGGQLGDGMRIDRSTPMDVDGLGNGVTAIAAGGSHTCALTNGGAVVCWGSNWAGQLGNDTRLISRTPVGASGLESSVLAITAGDAHTCALKTGGAVLCWGYNNHGQLGDGSTEDRYTPVDVVGLGSGAKAVVAGQGHTCAVKTSGAVVCWGYNSEGQLGDGTTTDSNTPVDVAGLEDGVKAIATGWTHTSALTDGGQVVSWGSNWGGQLGDGTRMPSYVPVHAVGLQDDVTAITTGDFHTCALTTEGAVMCWGRNWSGQLGDGTTKNRDTPVDVPGLEGGATAITAGGSHTCALMTSGGIRAWGKNMYGQLGDGKTTHSSTPVDVGELGSEVTAVALGRAHSCALKTGGGVACWGSNDHGLAGDGTVTNSSTPVDVVGIGSGALAITSGKSHVCALTPRGGVVCWGSNGHGQLGDGTTNRSGAPVDVIGLDSGVEAIGAGHEHTCALMTSGGVKCWGNNRYRQLGDGTTDSSSVPVDVMGLGSELTSISVGGYHACGLTSGGRLICWGYNAWGQLGDGTTDDSGTPVEVPGPGSGLTAIATGEYNTFAVTSGGALKSWGYNPYGQLGDGTREGRITPGDVVGLGSGVTTVSAGVYHTCAVKTGGELKCWGSNRSGQLGDGNTTDSWVPVDVVGMASGATAVDVGDDHTCALVGNGRVKCWGKNEYGQLGTGTPGRRTTPVDVIESLPPALAVNYSSGGSGSAFTVTGWGFLPGSKVALDVNGEILATSLPINPTGSFVVFLETASAGPGRYVVTAGAEQSASVQFSLCESVPLRPKEGGGSVFDVPEGIALPWFLLYLPSALR